MLAALLLSTLLAQPDRPPQDAVDRDRLMAAIAALPAERSADGGPDGWKGLKAAEDLVETRLRALGLEPQTRDIGWRPHFRQSGRAKTGQAKTGQAETSPAQPDPEPPVFRTISVDLRGRDLPSEVLLLSAHLDAVPGAPGADDDGTGIAALLELAATLRDRPMRRTVRLVFFNLEEVGLVGSTQYALGIARTRLSDQPADPSAPPETIFGMASLEMLGCFTDAEGSQKSPVPPIKGVFEPPTVGDFIALVTTQGHKDFARRLDELMRGSAPGLKTGLVDFAPDPPFTPPHFLRSDHAPFLALGIHAVMVTDTANFRNPHYHTADDTAATIDADRFTLVVRGLVGATYALAEPAAPDQPVGK
jgi:hypothetical protein